MTNLLNIEVVSHCSATQDFTNENMLLPVKIPISLHI